MSRRAEQATGDGRSLVLFRDRSLASAAATRGGAYRAGARHRSSRSPCRPASTSRLRVSLGRLAADEDGFWQGGGRRSPSTERAPRVNTHVHLPPNFSAFQTVEQALELAADAELQVLARATTTTSAFMVALQPRRVPKVFSRFSAWRSSVWWQSSSKPGSRSMIPTIPDGCTCAARRSPILLRPQERHKG